VVTRTARQRGTDVVRGYYTGRVGVIGIVFETDTRRKNQSARCTVARIIYAIPEHGNIVEKKADKRSYGPRKKSFDSRFVLFLGLLRRDVRTKTRTGLRL